jgi:toxin ParE1/3/4
MKLSFDPKARDELADIYDWIAQDNADAAYLFIERIEARVRDLAQSDFGNQGRSGLVQGTRELIVGPYIIVYETRDEPDEIVVLSIVHAARDR